MRLENIAAVLYPSTRQEIVDCMRIGIHYAILMGLPNLELVPSEATGELTKRTPNPSEGLLYEQDGNYVWVTPNAAEAARENPNTIFTAVVHHTGNKGKGETLYISSIETLEGSFGTTSESAIKRAQYLTSVDIQKILTTPLQKRPKT